MLPAMTAVDAGAPSAETGPGTSATPVETTAETVELTTPRGCPFLLSEEGGWRLDTPSRDHRCAAFSPPAPLAPEKQARLCLTPTHVTCATYLASLAAREARVGAPPTDRATRWGLARTTTVIEDPGGLRSRLLGAALDRRRWPAVPAVLLVTTLFLLALSGFRGGLPTTGAAATPSAPPPTVLPTRIPPTPQPTPQPTDTQPPATATLPPSLVPTGSSAPTPKPKPTYRTYVVQPGDTLSGIAHRFDTTVAALAALNNISDPSKLRVGQVLRIPN